MIRMVEGWKELSSSSGSEVDEPLRQRRIQKAMSICSFMADGGIGKNRVCVRKEENNK